MDIPGPKSVDMARPWTNVHVAMGAASDYGTEGFVAVPGPFRGSRS